MCFVDTWSHKHDKQDWLMNQKINQKDYKKNPQHPPFHNPTTSKSFRLNFDEAACQKNVNMEVVLSQPYDRKAD